MVKRENIDELSIGTSGRLSNLEGTGLSVDNSGNLNVSGGDGGESYIAEDFEEGDLSEYSGDTANFSVVAGDIAGGNMLQFDDGSGATQAIWNPSIQTRRGMAYAAYARMGGSASPTLVVNGQNDGASLTGGYGLFISSSRDEARLVTDPTDVLNTDIDTAAVTINTGTLYRLEIGLGFNTIQAQVVDDTETTVATLSGTDGTMDTGTLAWRDASDDTSVTDFDLATRQPFRSGP